MGYPDPVTLRAWYGTGEEDEDKLMMDPSTSSLLVLDELEHQIHEGAAYHFSTLSTGLANAGTIDLIWYTGATPAHLRYRGACSGTARLDLYEGPTATTQTSRTLRCRNRVDGDGNALSTLSDVSTMAATGTWLATAVMTTGSSLNDSGGEWVFKASTNYLIRLTNVSGGTQLSGITLDAYEHTPTH